MHRLFTQSLSLLFLLVAFPLIGIGTTSGPPVLWWVGIGALDDRRRLSTAAPNLAAEGTAAGADKRGPARG